MEQSQSNKALRLKYREIRNSISPDLRNVKSKNIIANVLALLESDFKGANIFLCFYPFGSEVDLIELYQKLLAMGKLIYFPVSDMKTHQLHFYQVNNLQADFSLGAYNIMEPKPTCPVLENDFKDSDVICITPGLVFDRTFNRIGYGGGFYDRFFSGHPGLIKLAPVFNEQLIDSVNAMEHDVPVDYIITEDEVLKGDKL